MKTAISLIIGSLGSLITILYGDITINFQTLFILMIIDFAMGTVTAAVFKKSKKTKSGALKSAEMTKGIFKKIAMLLLVAIAYRIQLATGLTYLRDVTTLSLIIEEVLSIIEKMALMGVPVPDIIKKTLDILSEKISEVNK